MDKLLDGLTGLLIPPATFAMICFVVYTIVNGLRGWHRQRVTGQFQSKLLDKIGSVNELGAFLNTEAGARFLKGLTTMSEPVGPHTRILRAIQSGAVFATLGVALYLYGWMTPTIRGEVTNAVNAVATIFFGIGIGFLVSATLSYRLSKELGLFRNKGRANDESPASTL